MKIDICGLAQGAVVNHPSPRYPSPIARLPSFTVSTITKAIRRARAEGPAVEFVHTLGWAVAPCEVADGSLRIVPDPFAHAVMYSPLRHLELPSELARLRRGDEAGLAEFASRYGLLGLGAWERSPRGIPGGRPRATESPTTQPPEPLAWCWQHIQTLRLALDLQLTLAAGDDDSLRGFVQSLAQKYPDPPGQGAALVPVAHAWWLTPENVAVRPDLKSLSEFIFDYNLEGVAVSQAFDSGRPCTALRFPALLPAVYWMVADGAQRGALRRCPECGTPFLAARKGQVFCPPPRGQDGKQLRRRCGSRFRTRRSRAAARVKSD